MNSIRKGAKVKLLKPDETWGEFYTVYKKEKAFVYLISDSKPEFGVCMTTSCKKVQLV